MIRASRIPPERERDIIERVAAREPYRSIARDHGTSPQSIHAIAKRRQALIDEVRQSLLDAAPSARDLIIETIQMARESSSVSLRSLGVRASERLLAATGIYPSHTPPTLVVGGDVYLTQTVQQVLHQASRMADYPTLTWDDSG